MPPLHILVILGSTREGKMSTRVGAFIKNVFQTQGGGHTIEILDPEELDLPVLKKALHFYRDPSEAPAVLHQTNDKVKKADAYVIVTAEYNRAMPPALVNTLNHLPPPSFHLKPAGIVSYSMGYGGGLAAAVSSRPFLAELGMLSLKTLVTIPKVHENISVDGQCSEDGVTQSLITLFKQLDYVGRAMKTMKESEAPPS